MRCTQFCSCDQDVCTNVPEVILDVEESEKNDDNLFDLFNETELPNFEPEVMISPDETLDDFIDSLLNVDSEIDQTVTSLTDNESEESVRSK